MPPVDRECSLLDVVAELSNQIEKLRHELAQLKKAHIGPKSERSKMPRVPSKPVTAEERLAKRRTQAADRRKVCGPPAALPSREGLRASRLPDRSLDPPRGSRSSVNPPRDIGQNMSSANVRLGARRLVQRAS